MAAVFHKFSARYDAYYFNPFQAYLCNCRAGSSTVWYRTVVYKQRMVPVDKWRIGATLLIHDDVIKWIHFPCYWPFVRGIHRLLVDSLHKDHWRRALMFSLICVSRSDWANTGDAGDLRRHRLWHHCNVFGIIIYVAIVESPGTIGVRNFHLINIQLLQKGVVASSWLIFCALTFTIEYVD